MVLDFLRYNEVVARMMMDPKMEGFDIYTMAAREVLGDPTLILTKEQRNACKQAVHTSVWAGSGESFKKLLRGL